MCDSLYTFCMNLCVTIDVTCLHAEEELSESEVDKYAGDFEQAFGKKNGIDLQNLRRKQRRLFQDVALEITACNVKQLIGVGFTSHYARKIFNSKRELFVQEDLIDKDGINLKLKHVEKIIQSGFSLRLHGTVVDWESLKKEIAYRKMSPAQREKLENQKMDAEMCAYWSKAVAYVENDDEHPGK